VARVWAQARFGLLGDIGILLDLAHNPRMLAFAAQMAGNRLRAAQSAEGSISAAGLYREIIDFWLTGEVERQQHRGGLAPLAKGSACRPPTTAPHGSGTPPPAPPCEATEAG
jgi:hypothetical protein